MADRQLKRHPAHPLACVFCAYFYNLSIMHEGANKNKNQKAKNPLPVSSLTSLTHEPTAMWKDLSSSTHSQQPPISSTPPPPPHCSLLADQQISVKVKVKSFWRHISRALKMHRNQELECGHTSCLGWETKQIPCKDTQ